MSGLGTVEVAVLCEELGRHAAPAPFVPTVLAIDAFAGAGDDEWVDRLIAGDALACVAWDPAAPVPYAPSADVAVVIADDGVYAMELAERPAPPARDGSHPRARLAAVRPAHGAPARRRRRARRASSTAARRSPRPICSAARRARSTSRSSTRRTACSSTARSDRSKP